MLKTTVNVKYKNNKNLFLLFVLFMKSITWWLVGIYILITLYGIYKYGVLGYIKRRREKKDTRIKNLINYNYSN
jgi:hypothetical protein